MKEIKLSNNKGIVLVDDEDYDMLSQYKWHLHDKKNKYAISDIKINGKSKRKKMHRLIMGEPQGFEIDHIDRNTLNNQKNNLRIVTHSQNQMNKIKQKNNTSGYKGVSWHKHIKKWQGQIGFNKKNYSLGYFENEDDAARAYNQKAKELFKEYVCLNEV